MSAFFISSSGLGIVFPACCVYSLASPPDSFVRRPSYTHESQSYSRKRESPRVGIGTPDPCRSGREPIERDTL